MSAWDKDIKDYCQSRGKEFHKVTGILTRDGWDVKKYSASMRDALFAWLDQWYTLSIKNLPTPATAFKRNPICVETYRRMTRLPGGWKVLTSIVNGKYLTQVMLNGNEQFINVDISKGNADATHTEIVEGILYDQS